MSRLRKPVGLDPITDLAVPLAVILMKVCWIYPWLAWMGNWPLLEWQQPPLSLASTFILLSVSFYAARFLPSRRWGQGRTRTCLVAILLITFFLMIRLEYRAGYALLDPHWFSYTGQILLVSFHQLNPLVMAVFAGAYLMWWGIRWGSSVINFSRIYRAFFTGLIGLAIILIVLTAGSGADTAAGGYAAGFFFCGLAALVLGNRQLFQKKAAREGRTRFFARRLSLVLIAIAGMVIFGIIMAGLLAGGDFWGNVVTALKTAGDWLYEYVISYLLLGIGYLLEGLFLIFNFLFNIIFSPPEFDPSEAVGEATPEPTPSTVTPMVIPEAVVLAIKWGSLIALAALVIFLLVKAYRGRFAAGDQDGVDESRESLWSWDLFRSDLRLFLALLWSKLKRPRIIPAPRETVPAWYDNEEIPYIGDVREIYRHLLWETAAAGINRLSYETTEEYTRRLLQAAPEGREPINEINRLYTRARYGDQPMPEAQMDLANRLWRTLRGQLRRRRTS